MKKLSERFSSDVFLILASLLIACVIWLIAKGNDTGQETIRVPLVLENKPENITAKLPRDTVQVTASFPKSLQAHILITNFQVVVDWNNLDSQDWIGIEDFSKSPLITLEPRQSVRPAASLSQNLRARIERQVQFLAIEPMKTYVEAKYVTRPVEMNFPTTGTLPEGYYLSGPIAPVQNRTLFLAASAQRFRELNATQSTSAVLISTEPIDLSNHTASFTESTNIIIPLETELLTKGENHSRTEDQRRLEVRVPISESLEQRTLERIPIQLSAVNAGLTVEYAPKTASVTVQGPQRLLRLLKASDFVVKPSQIPQEHAGLETTVSLTARLEGPNVSPEALKNVQITSVNPAILRVTYTWRERPVEPETGEEIFNSMPVTPMITPAEPATTPIIPAETPVAR